MRRWILVLSGRCGSRLVLTVSQGCVMSCREHWLTLVWEYDWKQRQPSLCITHSLNLVIQTVLTNLFVWSWTCCILHTSCNINFTVSEEKLTLVWWVTLVADAPQQCVSVGCLVNSELAWWYRTHDENRTKHLLLSTLLFSVIQNKLANVYCILKIYNMTCCQMMVMWCFL